MKKILQVILLLMPCVNVLAQNTVGSFDGSTSYINLGSTISTGVRTVEFLFKPTNTLNTSSANIQSIIARNDASNTNEWTVYLGATPFGASYAGRVVFAVQDAGVHHDVLSTTSTFSNTTCHHVCATIDPTAGMQLYIDGVLEASDPGYTAPIIAAPEIVCIGTLGDLYIRNYDGFLDEFSIWSRALSPAEINIHKHSPLNTATETGLVAYYKFNEGSGTMLVDETGTNSKTISGMTWATSLPCFDVDGIHEQDAAMNSFSIYPNPAGNEITVNLPGNTTPAAVTFYNSLGAVVMVTNLQKNSTINIAGLPAGTYAVIARTDKSVLSTKLVKE